MSGPEPAVVPKKVSKKQGLGGVVGPSAASGGLQFLGRRAVGAVMEASSAGRRRSERPTFPGLSTRVSLAGIALRVRPGVSSGLNKGMMGRHPPRPPAPARATWLCPLFPPPPLDDLVIPGRGMQPQGKNSALCQQ